MRIATAQPAVESHRLAGMEFAIKIMGLKPDALERVPALSNGEFEYRHAARAHQHGAAHFGDHAGCLAGLQLIQTAWILAVLVAERRMVEQVLSRLDALGLKDLGKMRDHAAHELNFIANRGAGIGCYRTWQRAVPRAVLILPIEPGGA